jgi:hypothetical protein
VTDRVNEVPGQVQLILDRSAVTGYLNAELAVGEALALLLDEIEPTYFGVHLTTLAEADRAPTGDNEDPPHRTVHLLMEHVAFTPVYLAPGDMRRLLDLAEQFDSVELAAALVSAYYHNGFVLTAHPKRYANADGVVDPRVIGF